MRLPGLLVIAACLCWHVPLVQANSISVFDVAADFSRSDNPNGVWSYGWSLHLGTPFVLSTDARVREGIDSWRGNRVADGNPGAYHNGTGSAIVLGGTALYDSGQFGLHPGPSGEYGVVRWTAPASGRVSLASEFVGQDLLGTTTDAHILHNNVHVFDSLIEGLGSSASLNIEIMMLVGDTLDFAIGFGRNGSYFNDSTGLAARITLNDGLAPIPEPSTFILVTIGLTGLLGRRHRRHPDVESHTPHGG